MGWPDGWESVGWARAWDLYVGLVFGGCVRAFVRMHMYSSMYVGWAGDGDGDADDGLRIWAEQVEGGTWTRQDSTRRVDKPSLGGSVGFRLG